MVKIPTYTGQTRAKNPISRSRPMIADSGADKVYAEAANFFDTISDIAANVKTKNQKIADERKKNEILDDLQGATLPIFEKYKTSNDVKNGPTNWNTETEAEATKIYDQIKTEYPALSEWFLSHAATNRRNNYITIESSINKNNRTQGANDLIDKKNLYFNQLRQYEFDQNVPGIMDMENYIYGNTEKGIKGLWDLKTEMGLVDGSETRAQFENDIKDEILLLTAENYIENDLDRYQRNNKLGLYNSLDAATKLKLDLKADGKAKTLSGSAASQLSVSKTAMVEKIKAITNVTDKGYSPNVAEIIATQSEAQMLHDILIANGKDGIAKELVELNNSLQVYSYVAPFRQMPLAELQAEYNRLNTNIRNNEGTQPVNETTLEVNKLEKLDQLIQYRLANEDNLLEVAVSSGLSFNGETIQPLDFSDISEEDMLELYKRTAYANGAAMQYNKEEPQFFFKSEKQQIANIINSGSEEDLKNLMINISAMGGASSYAAFSQISDVSDSAAGFAQLGTLYNITGPNPNIDAAIKAHSLRNDPTTQAILKQFNPNVEFKLSNIKIDNFGILQNSPSLDTRGAYSMYSQAADMIFEGMILNSNLNKKYDSGQVPINDAINMMQDAVQIAAGYTNGYGGIEEYNGYKITVPGVYGPNSYHLNADYGTGRDRFYNTVKSFEEILNENMNNDYLAAAVSSTPYLDNEFMDPPRDAVASDLFNQPRVHLVPAGFGKYMFVFGDDPKNTDLKVRDIDGNVVIFDVTKIYNQLKR